MHYRNQLLVWLWLPLLPVVWSWLSPAPTKQWQGFRVGWLLLLPLLGLSIVITCSTLRALKMHRKESILPNYDSLEALVQLRRQVLIACLLLPAIGACGVVLLLPEAIITQASIPALGLAPAMEWLHLILPAIPHQLPLWSSGLLLPFLSIPILWPGSRRFWGALVLLMAAGLVLLPAWREALFHVSTRKGWLLSFTAGGLILLASGLGFRTYAPKKGASWAWRNAVIASVTLYHAGLLGALWLSDPQLRRIVAELLLLPYALLLLFMGWKTLQAYRQFHRNQPEQPLAGHTAYQLAATWPWALLLAWLGWLYFGGKQFHQPLQQHPLAMLLILASQTLVYASTVALETIHSAKLHPPSRAWLFTKPLLLYLTAAMTLAIPAMAIFLGL